jgi:dTDP-glucose 4,6-dehydratase
MKNLLVTGGAGFIGSNFVRHILGVEPGVRVITLDALTYSGSLENLNGLPNAYRHTFIKGDICDSGLVARLLQENEIDTVVHFAAETHVDRSIVGPAPFIQTNIVGTAGLLEATRQYWLDGPGKLLPIKRFHHISTDEVYGSLASDDLAWTEESPYLPHSPYSASKAASDLLVKAYGHTYGLPYTLTNCTNNYGPFQFPEKLIPLVILNALEGKPLPVYGDGQQIRDWLHVQDHCEAITLVLGKGLPGSSYNVGGGNQPPNLVIVEMVCDLLDELDPHPARVPHRQFIQFVPDRPGHDRRYALNFQKIQQELGWQPRHSIEQGIRDTIAWYIAHADWVATIRKQKDYRTWLVDNYSRR